MTRTIFRDGDILYANQVNEIANPRLDGENLIGHGLKLIDGWLSDAADQIKSIFYSFYGRLKVNYNSGLTFSYVGGSILLSNGTSVTIPAGQITVPNNATTYIFVSDTGVVSQSPNLPLTCYPLAAVTTANGVLTGAIRDIRDKVIDRINVSKISIDSQIASGSGMDFWGTTLPAGWLWADGSFYEPETYPTLFAAFGYIHGQQGTKFKVPDKRGRVSLGAGQGDGLTNRPLGLYGGTENEVLTLSQIPSHTHGVTEVEHNHSVNDNGHTHNPNDPGHLHITDEQPHNHGFSDIGAASGGFAGIQANTSNVFEAWNPTLIQPARTGLRVLNAVTGITINSAKTNISFNASKTNININSNGGGGVHNNMPSFITCNYIIKI